MRRFSNTLIAFLAIALMFFSLIGNIYVVDLTERNMKATGVPIGEVSVLVIGCGDGTCSGDETCSSCSADCGACPSVSAEPSAPSAGGGPRQRPLIRNFIIEPELLKVSIKQGQTLTRVVTIANTGDTRLDFSVDLKNLADFILISEESFSLERGESKVLTLDFSAHIDEIPDVYSGLIEFSANGISKNLRVILEVESRKALFDVFLKIPEEYKQVKKGNMVLGDITILNMGDLMPVDVFVYYALKDFEGKILHNEQETLAISERLGYSKYLVVPQDAVEGTYIYYVKVDYGNSSAISSDTFEVVSEVEKPKAWITTKASWLWLLLLLLLLLNLWFWSRRKKKQDASKFSLRNYVHRKLRKGHSYRTIKKKFSKKNKRKRNVR